MTEHLLYGRKSDEPEWAETLLTCTTDAKRVAQVQAMAERDGFTHFRTATYSGERPMFGKNVLAI